MYGYVHMYGYMYIHTESSDFMGQNMLNYLICDRAYKINHVSANYTDLCFANLISFVPNALSHFHKLRKKPIKFYSTNKDFVAVVK